MLTYIGQHQDLYALAKDCVQRTTSATIASAIFMDIMTDSEEPAPRPYESWEFDAVYDMMREIRREAG